MIFFLFESPEKNPSALYIIFKYAIPPGIKELPLKSRKQDCKLLCRADDNPVLTEGGMERD